MPELQPLIVINAVGLTRSLLPLAPRLQTLAQQHWLVNLEEVYPSVTCSAQATMLTGQPVHKHGVVGNGWLFRETQEIRFWNQSNRLIQSEPVYVTAQRRAQEKGYSFRCAKLFWWFNQGAQVAFSLTPKPHYGIDGSKVFGISGTPEGTAAACEKELGPFPFFTFWGPRAGLPCTQWIAKSAALLLERERPELTLVYLPHLDYDPQRFGPQGSDMAVLVQELDQACAPLFDAAHKIGARIWIISEYGHCQVSRVVYLNRILRANGLLKVRNGPFGEQLETFTSQAFAVCDHQLAHIYVAERDLVPRVEELLVHTPGVDRCFCGPDRATIHLDHPRSGEIVVLAQPDSWFAYPFWLDDRLAPDYARSVAIHHKPGYDPCELLIDPSIRFPFLKVASKLLQKKLGLRFTMDLIPLEAELIKGSHGVPAQDPAHQPILIGTGPVPSSKSLPMQAFRNLLLDAIFN